MTDSVAHRPERAMKKSIEERIAAKRERRAQLAAQLAVLENRHKAAERKRDTRRKIVVGAAVLVEMERDPKFAAYVRKFLAKAVTRPQDREPIADLLQAATEITAPAVNGNAPPSAPPAGGTDEGPTPAAPGFKVAAREAAAG